jgi:GWxTD domain-containing protein
MHSPLHPLDDHVSCVYFMLMMDNVMAALLLRTKCARVLLLVGILLTGGWLDAFGQGTAPGVRLSTRQFLNEGEPYLEVQVEFMAEGLQWLMSRDSLVRAAAQWTVVAYDSTGAVAGFSKATARTGALPGPGDFVDVARIPLKPGPHVLELEVSDVALPEAPALKHEAVVNIDVPNVLDVSDLFLVQGVAPAQDPPTSLTRSGKEVLPLVDQRISADAEYIPFYGELYGTHLEFGEGGAFLVVAGFREPGGEWVESTRRFIRKKGAPVLPLLETVPVPDPGLYELVVEVQTPDQSLLMARSLFVEVVGSAEQDAAEAAGALSPFVMAFNDRDTLYAALETLLPIADAGERRTIEYTLRGADLRPMQAFLDQFWTVRHPDDPESGWLTYRREVGIADYEYGSCPNRQGHETDMGWILLRYGRPNTVVQRHNGTQYYPYEIWHYHKAGQFNNRRFLFYTPQVVGECFELLHSDHPQELRNADWLDILKTRELGHSVSETAVNQLGRRDTYSREEPEDLFFNPR